jgi:hypothetical protein
VDRRAWIGGERSASQNGACGRGGGKEAVGRTAWPVLFADAVAGGSSGRCLIRSQGPQKGA